VRREAVRLDVPPDWQLTLILAGVAVGLLAVLLFRSGKVVSLSRSARIAVESPPTSLSHHEKVKNPSTSCRRVLGMTRHVQSIS
jgi:hypothetical protein